MTERLLPRKRSRQFCAPWIRQRFFAHTSNCTALSQSITTQRVLSRILRRQRKLRMPRGNWQKQTHLKVTTITATMRMQHGWQNIGLSLTSPNTLKRSQNADLENTLKSHFWGKRTYIFAHLCLDFAITTNGDRSLSKAMKNFATC